MPLETCNWKPNSQSLYSQWELVFLLSRPLLLWERGIIWTTCASPNRHENFENNLLFWTTLSFNKKDISPALIFVLIPLPHSPSGSNLEVIAEILLRTLRNSTNLIMNVVTQKLKSHAHAGGVFDSSYKAFGNRGKSFVFSTCSYL